MLPEKAWYRITEVADHYRVTRRTVYAWIGRGVLGSVTIQGVLRIPRAGIVDLERRSTRGPGAAEAEERTS